jgi:UrcA family protein
MTKTIAMMLIAGGLGTGIAGAQPPVTVYAPTAPSAKVSYADLNMRSEQGVNKLQARVRHAASGLCLIESREMLEVSLKRKGCYDTAVRDGYAKIDQVVAEKMAGKSSLTTAILIVAR